MISNRDDYVKMSNTITNFEKLFNELNLNNNKIEKTLDNNIINYKNEEEEANQLINQIKQENKEKLSNDFDKIKNEEEGNINTENKKKLKVNITNKE